MLVIFLTMKTFFIQLFFKANKRSAEFKSVYKSIEQLLTVKFTTLNIVLHLEAILDVLDFAKRLQTKLEDTQKRFLPQNEDSVQTARRRRSSGVSSVFDLAKDVAGKISFLHIL